MALKRGILDYFTEIAENVCGFINKYRRIPPKCNKILGKFRGNTWRAAIRNF